MSHYESSTFNIVNIYQMMWQWTIQKYPKLAVIDDDNYVHAILACRTEEAQDDVLKRFLENRKDTLFGDKK